jgi:hypothetical protein
MFSQATLSNSQAEVVWEGAMMRERGVMVPVGS